MHALKREWRAFEHWARVFLILMVENFAGRYKMSRIGWLFAIIEPFGLIGLMAVSNSLMASKPPFGSSNTLFYATGILPFYLMFHVTLRVRGIESLRAVPRTTRFDVVFANILDEFITKILIMALCFGTLTIAGAPDALPQDPLGCVAALLALSALGFGVGLCNAVITSFFHSWHFVFVFAFRALLAFSGVISVVDRIPYEARQISLYNPLSHGVTWFRASFYSGYPQVSLDINFLVMWCVVSCLIGMLAFDATRGWRT